MDGNQKAVTHIKRALISVSDKQALSNSRVKLTAQGVEILSTGGTLTVLLLDNNC